jgi:hypothetical protein
LASSVVFPTGLVVVQPVLIVSKKAPSALVEFMEFQPVQLLFRLVQVVFCHVLLSFSRFKMFFKPI